MADGSSSNHSAGIVIYRRRPDGVEILLVHPGGPFWSGKDEHAWSIPKGEYQPDNEEALVAARREYAEEIGHPPPDGDAIELGEFRAGSKRIRSWLIEGDLDVDTVVSNTFEMEWPPRSGRRAEFPEVDRAAWVALTDATARLHKGQAPLVARIEAALSR